MRSTTTRLLLLIGLAIGIFMAGTAQPEITPIHDVQGEGSRSGMVNETVTVQGIVTADFQGNLQLGGFYMQEEDADTDGNPQTSEGIFVYCDPDDIYEFRNNLNDAENAGLCTDNPDIADVSEGDLVAVEGIVKEAFGQTHIDATGGSVTIISSGHPLPAPVMLDLRRDLIDTEFDRDDYYEAYEGMLITIRDVLTISEYYQYSRYGQLVLYQGGRPHQYTHEDDTPTPEEYISFTRA